MARGGCGRRRRSQSGLGSLADAGVAAEATGEHRRRHRLEMGLASHRGGERFEAPGGIEQQRRSVPAARADERDLRAQPLQSARVEARRAGQARPSPATRAPRPTAAGIELRLRGSQGPPPPLRGIGRQLGRARQERRSRRHAPARLRPVGRALQLAGHRLVNTQRRVSTMPRPTIGIGIRIGHLRQRRDAQLAARRRQPPGMSRIAPVDAGSGHALRSRPAARLLQDRARSFRCRACEPRARQASRRPSARPRPAAAVAVSAQAARLARSR